MAASLPLLSFSGGMRSTSPSSPISQVGPPPSPEPEFSLLPSVNDLLTVCWEDAQSLIAAGQVHLLTYVRWVIIQDTKDVADTVKAMKITSLTLNHGARGPVIQRPLPLAGGRVLRVDLRQWWPRATDLKEAAQVWEDFQYDPTTSILLTKDTIRFLEERAKLFLSVNAPHLAPDVPPVQIVSNAKSTSTVQSSTRKEQRTVDHPGGDYTYPDGQGTVRNMPPGRYVVNLEFRETPSATVPPSPTTNPAPLKSPYPPGHPANLIPKSTPAFGEDGKLVVARLDPKHINVAMLNELRLLTGSQAPVVEHRYLKFRMLSTIRDRNDGGEVYDTVLGGRYYQFRGIKKAKDVLGKDTKASDLDLYFESIGVGNIKAGVTAEKLFDNLRSDQRVLMAVSGITGKPREVDLFPVESNREGESRGAITGDVRRRDIDVSVRAFFNLLTPARKAREAIFPAANGTLTFTLWNEQGELQDSVPSDIAADTTIPDPYVKDLEPAIGCLRCHYRDGSDGWKPLRNEARSILGGRLDIVGDLGAGKNRELLTDTIDRLAGLYTGTPDKHIRRLRDDVAETTLRCTGPWIGDNVDPAQTDIAKVASLRLEEEYNGWIFRSVDAQQALHEMGYVVRDKKKAIEVLRRLLPPDNPKGIPIAPGVFLPEDARVSLLKDGIGINRSDFVLVQSYLAERVDRSVKQNLKEGKKWHGE